MSSEKSADGEPVPGMAQGHKMEANEGGDPHTPPDRWRRDSMTYSDYADASDSGIDLPSRRLPLGPIPKKISGLGPCLGPTITPKFVEIEEVEEQNDPQPQRPHAPKHWLPRENNSCAHAITSECPTCTADGESSVSNDGVPLTIPQTAVTAKTASGPALPKLQGKPPRRRERDRDRDRTSQAKNSTKWQRLINLKDLYDEGFITLEEYKERKLQLVDELTGTSVTATAAADRPLNTSKLKALPPPIPVVPHAYPDFTDMPILQAVQHHFDLKSGVWSEHPVEVQLDRQPFAKGGLRYAYYLRLAHEPTVPYVAKAFIDPHEDPMTYFQDVEMQIYCREWASKYNEYHPPKHVEFIPVWLMTVAFPDGSQQLYVVENLIEGHYKKHNNNAGYVDQDDRNTPQAFSHFTYESSNHSVLVCDIQGVGDVYTDPQMHTLDGSGFGKGNLGVKGFERFLQTHRCNAICHYFRLPSVNRKPFDAGTMPAQRLMDQPLESHSPQLPPHVLSYRANLRAKQVQVANTASCCTIL